VIRDRGEVLEGVGIGPRRASGDRVCDDDVEVGRPHPSTRTSIRRLLASPREPPPASPLLVTAFGMQLHAAVTVDGRDRSRLERVCRYLLRPPFAQDAIERTADGQVRVHFKKPNRFGATYAQMSPDTFDARALMGHELESDLVADVGQVFEDYASCDFRIVDGPCAGRGATLPAWAVGR
jgi:hypothetical protein